MRKSLTLWLIAWLGSAALATDLCDVETARQGGIPVVLVVDKDPMIRHVIGLTLAARKYFPVPAAHSAEAEAILQRIGPVDAALIGKNLRGPTGPEDGQALAERLIRDLKIPCALMSGGYSTTSAVPGYVTLPRPFRPDTFDEVLRALLQRP